jgi:hypothetical protein
MENRNRPDRKSSGNSANIDQDVQSLFHKDKSVSKESFNKLMQKYGDPQIVDKIFEAYNEKHQYIVKKAKKFAFLIREKYGNSNYPFHILLEKARLYKVKHGLSDDEFTEFVRIFEQELIGKNSHDIMIPRNNMMKVLGSVNFEFNAVQNKLNDTDYKYLQEILKLYAVSKPLHSQALIQSMQYTEFAPEAMAGTYDPKFGHKRTDAIHPVIAAMFIPKITKLEEHFLYSNIAGIVKSRYNNQPLNNKPDYELFYALTNDHNDIVCDSQSPMQDLLNRALVQNQLWSSVVNLRNGQYYTQGFRDFVNAVDICRSNKFDTPDLIYGRYDGTILKRLLATFSYRPTLVATMAPGMNTVMINPYQQYIRPIVTTVPMINIRLPISDDIYDIQTNGLSHAQVFLENGFVSVRDTSVIYSKDVLFFFIDRRVNIIRYSDMTPYNIDRLPPSIAGFERIHLGRVDINPQLVIDKTKDKYDLVSIVNAKVSQTNNINRVIGSFAVLKQLDQSHRHIYHIYAPDDAANPLWANKPFRSPVQFIEISKMCSQQCVILMYKLTSDNDLSKGNLPVAT